MKSCTLLHLLTQAIEITNKMAAMKVRDLASAEAELHHDLTYLMGYLRALEAVIRHEDVPLRLHNDENEDLHHYEVEKIKRRLQIWSRKPGQINSCILAKYLRLRHEQEIWPIPVKLLRHSYVQERCLKMRMHLHQADREFMANFSQMKTITVANDAKIFELDSDDNVLIWAKAAPAVEIFRRAMLIGE